MNIRKFVLSAKALDELVGLGTLTPQAARFVEAPVVAGLNVIVAGGTQAGKPSSGQYTRRPVTVAARSPSGRGSTLRAPNVARCKSLWATTGVMPDRHPSRDSRLRRRKRLGIWLGPRVRAWTRPTISGTGSWNE